MEGQAEGVAVLEAGHAAAPRRGARGAARGRDLPAAGPRRDAAQARRGRAAGARRRQVAQGRDPGRLRALLHGRHRAGIRARRAGAGRAHHARRPRELAAAARGAAAHELSRRRGLQARHLDPGPGAAADAQHPRELRPARAGLQQRELHPHAVPGDEPRVRRPRLLLRRPVLPAGRAAARPAVEGIREGARGDDPAATATTRTRAPAIRIRSRAARTRTPASSSRSARASAGAAPAQELDRAAVRAVPGELQERHDQRDRGRCGGLARVGDAERRLDPGHDRRPHRHRAQPAHAVVRARPGRRIRSTCSSPASARA